MDGPVKHKGKQVMEAKKRVTYEECKEICIDDDKCNSFTYHMWKRECFFMDKKLFGNEQLDKENMSFYSAYKVCTKEGKI